MESEKIKGAQAPQIKLINLRQLEQLLLGRVMIKVIRKLDRLTKASFKGNTYRVSGATNTAPEGKWYNMGAMSIGVLATYKVQIRL